MIVARIETCKSCGAEIIRAVGKSGKVNPIDAEPVAPDAEILGNVRLVDTGEEMPLALYDRKGDTLALDDDGTRYVSHFVTCPQAADWRRG